MRQVCLSAILLSTACAQAEIMEVLSQSAYTAANLGGCPKYDETAARTALKKFISNCQSDHHGLAKQTQDLTQVATEAEDGAENQFFAALALQHSNELSCASRFAGAVASGNH